MQIVSILDELATQVRTDEPGTAGDSNPLSQCESHLRYSSMRNSGDSGSAWLAKHASHVRSQVLHQVRGQPSRRPVTFGPCQFEVEQVRHVRLVPGNRHYAHPFQLPSRLFLVIVQTFPAPVVARNDDRRDTLFQCSKDRADPGMRDNQARGPNRLPVLRNLEKADAPQVRVIRPAHPDLREYLRTLRRADGPSCDGAHQTVERQLASYRDKNHSSDPW